MSYYTAPFTFDYAADRIQVDAAVADVDVIELYAAIRDAQATEEGILHGPIASGSGLVDLGGGVQVGITVQLLGGWQLRFAEGAYIARVTSGNLVGGPGGNPIAYSAGVQTLLIQSAASTVVTVSEAGAGSAPTASENAAAVWSAASRALTSTVVSDVRYVNGIQIDGTGTEANPWGPA